MLHPGPEWWVKIAGFGNSKRIESTTLQTAISTQTYLAPEVLGIYTAGSEPEDGGVFSMAVDIWSVGVIAFQLVTGRLPFLDTRQLHEYVVRKSPFETESSVRPECGDFIRKTIVVSPHDRLSSREALAHPWIGLRPVDPPDEEDPGAPVTVTMAGGALTSFSTVVKAAIHLLWQTAKPSYCRHRCLLGWSGLSGLAHAGTGPSTISVRPTLIMWSGWPRN